MSQVIADLSVHDANLIADELLDRQLIDNRAEKLRVIEALDDLAKGIRHKFKKAADGDLVVVK